MRSFTAWTVRSPVKRMLRLLDFDELGHAQLGYPLVIVGGALERGADPQQHGLIEGAADQLHADRKPVW